MAAKKIAVTVTPANEATAASIALKVVKTPKHTGKFILTTKGYDFVPVGKSVVSKTKDQITWPKLRDALKGGAMAYADIMALIADHKSYFGYALKRGWITSAAE